MKTHKSLYFTYLLNKIFIIVQCKHSLHRDHLHSWKHGLNIQIQVIFTWTHQVFNKFLSFHCSYNYKASTHPTEIKKAVINTKACIKKFSGVNGVENFVFLILNQ